jgi:uncharacterized protein (DUF2345 family)
VIRLTDESGKEKIEVIDRASKNRLVIDTVNNTITIEAEKDIVLNAKTGAIKLTAQTIEMDAKQKVSAKAPDAKVEATGPLQLKGGVAELSATGNTKISGAMVMIN